MGEGNIESLLNKNREELERGLEQASTAKPELSTERKSSVEYGTKIDVEEFKSMVEKGEIIKFNSEEDAQKWIEENKSWNKASGKFIKSHTDYDKDRSVLLVGPGYISGFGRGHDLNGDGMFVDKGNNQSGIELNGFVNLKDLTDEEIVAIAEKYCYKLRK